MSDRFREFFVVRHAAFASALLFVYAIAGHADAGLMITPTYDSSITNDPNAGAIETTINNVIQTYQSTYTNPINVTIQFTEGSGLGGSQTTLHVISYTDFLNALQTQQSISQSSNQATALAHLPSQTNNPVNGTQFLYATTANIKALALGSPVSSLPGGFDGIITLNTALTDPGSLGSSLLYSLAAVTMHEIDEVLGLGSAVGSSFPYPRVEDLYRYDSTGNRNYTTSGDNAYFSIDGTNDLVQFNQRQQFSSGDYGDWHPGSGTARVQDAFATAGANPTLGVELTALDVIGYDRVTSVPEPSTLVLWSLMAGVFGIGGGLRNRLKPVAVAA